MTNGSVASQILRDTVTASGGSGNARARNVPPDRAEAPPRPTRPGMAARHGGQRMSAIVAAESRTTEWMRRVDAKAEVYRVASFGECRTLT